MVTAPAQTFTKLVDFNYENGENHTYMLLVQGLDGAMYGATTKGGTYGYGTVFKITPAGLTTIYNFDNTVGSLPMGSLLLATDGNLYGTTEGGGIGSFAGGIVYKITPGGALTTVYSFGGGPGGSNPNAGLIQGTDGNFYGTTLYRGDGGSGTAYQLTPAGTLTVLHSFANDRGNEAAFPSATDPGRRPESLRDYRSGWCEPW